MRKKIFLICFVGLMTLCCACGKKEEVTGKNNTSTEKQSAKEKQDETESVEIETEDESLKKPDEERMLKDLEEKKCNTLTFSEWEGTATIPIVKLTLDKAKDKDDSYLAYCTLELKDDVYSGKVTYALTYSYYDIGGWMLDEVTEENREIEAISCVQEQWIQEYIKKEDEKAGKLTVTDFKDGWATEKENNWLYCLTKRCATAYVDYYYGDSVVCSFDCNKGWAFTDYQSNYSSQDWARIVGTKWYGYYEGYEDESNQYYITIKEYDLSSMTVTVDVEIYYPYGFSYQRDEEGEWSDKYVVYSYSGTLTDELGWAENCQWYTNDTTMDTHFHFDIGESSDDFAMDFSPNLGVERMGYTNYVITRIE